MHRSVADAERTADRLERPVSAIEAADEQEQAVRIVIEQAELPATAA